MHMKVAMEQFVVRDDEIVHTPTGATFHKGDGSALVEVDWGSAGKPHETGHDYRPEDILEVAHQILVTTRIQPIG